MARRDDDDDYDEPPRRRRKAEMCVRIAVGCVAIQLGALGIHKFLMGKTGTGVITLLITLFGCGIGGIVMYIIGIIEGITYLKMSDREFENTYLEDGKNWM